MCMYASCTSKMVSENDPTLLIHKSGLSGHLFHQSRFPLRRFAGTLSSTIAATLRTMSDTMKISNARLHRCPGAATSKISYTRRLTRNLIRSRLSPRPSPRHRPPPAIPPWPQHFPPSLASFLSCQSCESCPVIQVRKAPSQHSMGTMLCSPLNPPPPIRTHATPLPPLDLRAISLLSLPPSPVNPGHSPCRTSRPMPPPLTGRRRTNQPAAPAPSSRSPDPPPSPCTADSSQSRRLHETQSWGSR